MWHVKTQAARVFPFTIYVNIFTAAAMQNQKGILFYEKKLTFKNKSCSHLYF